MIRVLKRWIPAPLKSRLRALLHELYRIAENDGLQALSGEVGVLRGQLEAAEQQLAATEQQLEVAEQKLETAELQLGERMATEQRLSEQLQVHEDQLETVFKGIPRAARRDIQFFERLQTAHGILKSTADMSDQERMDAALHFQHRDKVEVALTAASSWYGGDYFEFGSHDLATFRNMLSAYDIFRMDQSYPDTRFYAFDIFGKFEREDPSLPEDLRAYDEQTGYFSHFTGRGDQYELHLDYIKQHRLYEDRCILVQGLFQDTLTDARRRELMDEGREIGFAFIDVNIGPSYKLVFDWIFPLLARNSYIYMDEYFQNRTVIKYLEQFTAELRQRRGLDLSYVRNADGFGALFRVYHCTLEEPPLELPR